MKYYAHVVMFRKPKSVLEVRVNHVIQLLNKMQIEESMIQKEYSFLLAISSQLARISKSSYSRDFVQPCRVKGVRDIQAFKVGSFARIQFVTNKPGGDETKRRRRIY